MDARVEKVLNLPTYQRALIVLVIVTAIGAGFYFTVYQGQVDEYSKLVERRDAAQVQLQKNQRIAAKLKVYKEEYAKLQEDLKLALGELPLKKEIPSLLTNIGALAKEKGLDIIRFQPKGENVKGFYAEVPVALKLSGSYHQAALFFDAVGKMERIVNIQGLKMGSGKDVDGKTNLAIDCSAITFRFIEGGTAQAKKAKKGGRR
ncbi:type IV pilus assembly protein PilO [Malonomonas rubra DSM 5091]|uniref:Type IV pilus assembly protein PilO n=1 Tax=Malonomonas rubra DSM 5091 TaxID=1122189 RepID=A0A1M6D765_MALRU|nr:type 4a pilus biogenesis protein PilO [Malonomonas rubra]SHI69029.1 type IV pilus assembly protein PilO [Malonomonas rubra DSM 5091]